MTHWRALLLPREHGIWGFLAGAALVGLPLGRDCSGLPLLATAVAAAVLRQAASVRPGVSGRSLVVVTAACIALAGVVGTALLSADLDWLPWMLGAAVLGLVCMRWSGARSWWGSALAGVAAAALAGGVAMAGGADLTTGAVGAGALAAHLVSTVPLVRAQTRHQPTWSIAAIELHGLAAVLAVGGWAAGLWAWGIPLIFVLGLARAAHLVDKRTPMSDTPASIGLRELAWLPVVAACVVLSLRGGWC